MMVVEVSRDAAFLLLGCHHVAGIELTNYKLWGALAFVKPRGVTGWVFNRGNRDGNL